MDINIFFLFLKIAKKARNEQRLYFHILEYLSSGFQSTAFYLPLISLGAIAKLKGKFSIQTHTHTHIHTPLYLKFFPLGIAF